MKYFQFLVRVKNSFDGLSTDDELLSKKESEDSGQQFLVKVKFGYLEKFILIRTGQYVKTVYGSGLISRITSEADGIFIDLTCGILRASLPQLISWMLNVEKEDSPLVDAQIDGGDFTLFPFIPKLSSKETVRLPTLLDDASEEKENEERLATRSEEDFDFFNFSISIPGELAQSLIEGVTQNFLECSSLALLPLG
jgi:hypothetical protein